MGRQLRGRFWLEAATACMAAGLLLITALGRNWIELVLGVDPDGGDGSFEWLVVLAPAAVLAASAALARREWMRA